MYYTNNTAVTLVWSNNMKITDIVGKKFNSVYFSSTDPEGIGFNFIDEGRYYFTLAASYPEMWILDGPRISEGEHTITKVEITPYPHDDVDLYSSDRYEIHTDKDMYTFVVFKSDLCDKKEWFDEGYKV